jgi:dolichyl-diphosphooligosaccharide--protein glycosyltransferase
MSDAVTSDSSASRAAFARALRGCAPFALFAFAFAIRAIRWREVFVADRVVPIGFDVYYHLRRISVSVFRHPAFLDFDAYLHFPDGAQPIWPPLFDRAVAAVLRPLVSKELESGLDSMERLAMWVPPVLGALTVVVVFELTRRHFGFRAGLLAGTVLSFLSGHVWYSQLGFLDHHVAVALFAALVLGSALRMVASMDAGRRGASWAWAVALGGSGAGALLLWPGSLLHIGLVHVALLADMLRRPSVGARALAARLAAAHAVALVTVAPSGLAADWLQWSAFSPVVVSRFQPLLFALATLVCGSCALVWSTPGRSGSLGRRLAVFCSVGTLGSVISLVAQPEILEGAQDAWRWLAKDEAFQSQVVESMPLFFESGRFTPVIALTRLSGFVLLFPFAAGWLWFVHRKRQTRTALALLRVFAVGLMGVTLLQKRFFNSASIGVAIVLALAVQALWWRARSRTARFMIAAALVFLLAPTLMPYMGALENERRSFRGQKISVGGTFSRSLAQQEMATWLRDGTPATSGWLGDGAGPEYSVLAPWPLGHIIQYMGRRPTVVDNFGDDLGGDGFAFAERVFRAPGAEGVEALDARGVRYVVAQPSKGFLSAPAPQGSLLRVLYHRDGSASPEAVEAGSSAALARYRLVFESKGLWIADPEAKAVYKVFEVVPGAVIEGRAAPGSVVDLRLGVFTNRGRKLYYRTRGVADETGKFQVRVPYATGAKAPSLRTAPLYRLSCRGEVRGVAVAEEAVAEGLVVSSPSLCLAPDDEGGAV